MTTDNPIEIAPFTAHETLEKAFIFANNTAHSLIQSDKKVAFSVIAADLFKKPRNRQVQILGVCKKAGVECAKLAPGGKWWVECNAITDDRYQFMAWYSKYLPYAYAMMRSEDGFEAQGIDFQSINSYFKSCLGFVWIGQGHGDVKEMPPDVLRRLGRGEDARDFVELQESHVIEDEDLKLYEKFSNASWSIRSPELPFYEALMPACVFVAYRRPDLFCKFIGWGQKRRLAEALDDYRYQHVVKVIEACDLKLPKFPWGKRPK